MGTSFLYTVAIVLLAVIAKKTCSSYPAKNFDPIPLFLMKSLPLEIDEPSNKVEDLIRGGQDPEHGEKWKRNRIFSNNADSCCPTIVEVIEPLGGKNRSGDLVELYQGDGVRQRFYEISCAASVSDNPCKFVDRRHHSKCVQQYSYTYALVRDFGVDYDEAENGGWRLDYIQVRSGCACQIHRGHHHSS